MTKLCELKLFKRSQFTKIYHLKKAPPVKLDKKNTITFCGNEIYQKIVVHSFKKQTV